MLQTLASGVTIIMDRYSFSGAAYSAAKGKSTMSLQVKDHVYLQE